MLVGALSDKGKMRITNEDAYSLMEKDKVYIVADGVGGGNTGEIASRVAVEQIEKYISDNSISSVQGKYRVVRYFQECIENANKEIVSIARTHVENSGMATTLIIVYNVGNRVFICNVGDSRVYLFRNHVLEQLTEDHTYVNSLLKAGLITEEEALVDIRKNVITKALGADETVQPDYYQLKIEEGDVLLLCTDGLYNELREREISEIIEENDDMQDVCNLLVNTANDNGGNDNITVVCIKATEEDINEH